MADLLFLPAPEHRGALLDDGVGGARMPCVYVSYVSGEGFRLSRDFPALAVDAERAGLGTVIRVNDQRASAPDAAR